jgi:peptide/nickel transport system substrate-binding protein
MWAKADIRLKISAIDRLPWIDDGRAGKFEALSHGLTSEADPHLFMRSRTGSAGNWAGYSNPAVDKLWDQAEGEYDTAKRGEIYRQIQKIVFEDAFHVTGYMYPTVGGWNKKVKNYTTWFNHRYLWME